MPTQNTQLDPVLQKALAAANDTKDLSVGHGNLQFAAEMFRNLFPNKTAFIIADQNTYKAAGETVYQVLSQVGLCESEPFIITDPSLYAEFRFVDIITDVLKQHNAIPVAVGSGTINDLVKLASHYTNRPYMCVATAASMDGYTAYGASITKHGSKQTFFCPAPRCVLADLDVICNAPKPMNASGYADLMAKVTAGADWIIADALGFEPIDQNVWATVHDSLMQALEDPQGVQRGDSIALEKLTTGLMMGGFAMQAHQTSRPASGAEHQFSHLWDMQHHTHDNITPSHGFKVSIGTIASTKLHQALISDNLEALDIDAALQKYPTIKDEIELANNTFDIDDIKTVAHEELKIKHILTPQLKVVLTTLKNNWPLIRTKLQNHLLDAETLIAKLNGAGAPTTPQQIGITPQRLHDTYHEARMIRRRFTVLDLAFMTGKMNTYVDSLFT
ncbi:sn-glycerol-1-phosphate dehydrogenase [Planctomycetota bacterium]|nr:sn-glycerol-1-phosphate dehydrogenase [Planctomycetota bacterium]